MTAAYLGGGCATSKPADESLSKRISTLQARAALVGLELVALADGSWIVSRCGQFRTLKDIATAERFLLQAERSQ